MRLAILACVLVACGTAYIPSGYIGEEDVPKRRIVGARQYVSWNDWANSPYFRIDRDRSGELPVLLLIEQNGQACVVPSEIWAINPRYMACPDGWRVPRVPER